MTQLIFRKIALILFLCFQWPAIASAGQGIVLTIGEAYQLARQHYPQSRQRELIKRSMDYSLDNAAKGYLPKRTWMLNYMPCMTGSINCFLTFC